MHVDTQFSQCYLLKRLSFLQCMFLAHFSFSWHICTGLCLDSILCSTSLCACAFLTTVKKKSSPFHAKRLRRPVGWEGAAWIQVMGTRLQEDWTGWDVSSPASSSLPTPKFIASPCPPLPLLLIHTSPSVPIYLCLCWALYAPAQMASKQMSDWKGYGREDRRHPPQLGLHQRSTGEARAMVHPPVVGERSRARTISCEGQGWTSFSLWVFMECHLCARLRADCFIYMWSCNLPRSTL